MEVGMVPSKVLNEEDRKKYTHPKKKQKVMQSFFSRLNSSYTNGQIPNLIDIRNGLEPIPGPSGNRSRSSSDSDDYRRIDDLSFLTQELENSYFEAYNDTIPDHHSVNLLISGHINLTTWTPDHSQAFIKLMSVNVAIMHLMAKRNKCFMSLSYTDQSLLLQHNANLLKEYVICRYVLAKTGSEQAVWITGPKESVFVGKQIFDREMFFEVLRNLGICYFLELFFKYGTF